MIHTHKLLDCTIGTCAALWGAWLGDHWMAILGGALILWRAVQTFVLEPWGIDVRPGWFKRFLARRTRIPL